MNLTLYAVSAFLVIDSDGQRVLAKYYHPKLDGLGTLAPSAGSKALVNLKDQRAFEKGLFSKTKKPNSDIILYDGHLAVYKHSLDLIFYIIGAASENELMLHSALNAFTDAISMLLRNQVEKRALLENLDLVLLALDETIDEGIILETDAPAIASRVSRPKADLTGGDLVINEETLAFAYNTVKGKLQQRLAQGF